MLLTEYLYLSETEKPYTLGEEGEILVAPYGSLAENIEQLNHLRTDSMYALMLSDPRDTQNILRGPYDSIKNFKQGNFHWNIYETLKIHNKIDPANYFEKLSPFEFAEKALRATGSSIEITRGCTENFAHLKQELTTTYTLASHFIDFTKPHYSVLTNKEIGAGWHMDFAKAVYGDAISKNSEYKKILSTTSEKMTLTQTFGHAANDWDFESTIIGPLTGLQLQGKPNAPYGDTIDVLKLPKAYSFLNVPSVLIFPGNLMHTSPGARWVLVVEGYKKENFRPDSFLQTYDPY